MDAVNMSGTNSADNLKFNDLSKDKIFDALGGNDILDIEGGTNNTYNLSSGYNIVNVKKGSGTIINLGADRDTINVYNGSVKQIRGIGKTKADSIKITRGSIASIELGTGGDKIVANGGSINSLSLGDGYNTVYVSGGKVDYIQGGNTNDTLTVSSGEVGTIVGTNTRQKLTIKGTGKVSEADLRGGSDVISLENDAVVGTLNMGSGDNYTYIYDNAQVTGTIYGGTGVDRMRLDSGSIKNIAGGSGVQRITIDGGMVGNIDVGSGDDLISITGGTVQNITLDEGNNQTYIYGGSVEGTIYGGSGNNKIKIVSGNVEKIKGTTGAMTVILEKDANVKTIQGGSAVDIVYSNYANDIDINLGDGNDVVYLENVTESDVWGGSGNDTIKVVGGFDNYIECGEGNDRVTIDWSTVNASTTGEPILVLNESESGNMGNDTLIIRGANFGDFYINKAKYYLNRDNDDEAVFSPDGTHEALIITDKNNSGKQIWIMNFDANPLYSVGFDDGFVRGDNLIIKQLNINDGQSHGSVFAGNASFGVLDGYTVNLTNGTTYDVYAAFDTSTRYSVDTTQLIANNNTVNIGELGQVSSGSRVKRDVKTSYVNFGSATGNTAILNGGYIEGDLLGAQVRYGTVSSNTAIVNSGIVRDVYGAEGLSQATNVTNNLVEINGGNVRAVYGGYGNGAIEDNKVYITNGKIYNGYSYSNYYMGKIVICGGYSEVSSASKNIVNISGGSIGALYSGYVAGGITRTGDVFGNILNISGGDFANEIRIHGGTTINGSAYGNEVHIFGDAIVGSVVINESVNGTTGDGFFSLKDNAKVRGTIYGGSGVDTIKISGGSVDYGIDAGDGNDIIEISGGSVDYGIDAGDGNDTIKISGGSVYQGINAGDGNDTIEISGGYGGIDAGAGDDVILIKEGKGYCSVYAGNGDDIIVVSGGTSNTLYGQSGNDNYVFNMDSALTASAAIDDASGTNGIFLVNGFNGTSNNISARWNTDNTLDIFATDNENNIVKINATSVTYLGTITLYDTTNNQKLVYDAVGLKSALQGVENACLSFADTQVASLAQIESLTDTDSSYLTKMTIASSNNISR